MNKSERHAATPGATAPRGRPRTFDRDKAVAQATLLFWRKGYAGTSIADLTAEIGIEPPSLYAAFGSKKALFAASLQHYIDRYQHAVWSKFDAAGSAREAVQAYLSDTANALSIISPKVPRGCMVVLAGVERESDPDLGNITRSARAIAYERLTARISAAVVAGELPETVDVRGLASFVQSVQNGMSIIARDGSDREQLRMIPIAAMAAWDALAHQPA